MGRIGQENQPQYQSEHSQPQEYQHEPDTVDVPPPSYETFYTDEYQNDTYQNESSNPPEKDPQTQQQQTPYQQQPQNPQQAQPGQFPRPNPQSNGPQPVVYPPPSPQMGPQSQNYPPRAQPQAYPPRAQQQGGTGFASQAVQFPPPASFSSPVYAASGYVGNQAMPPSPHKPVGPMNDTPIMGTPVQNQFSTPQVGTDGWKTDLFGCMDDPNNALITACFPCLTFGQIAEILDQGQTPCATSGMLYGLIACCIAMPCLMSCTYRTKLRSRFGLIESPAPDWITHCLCEWCALCQEYRELQARGIDPSIGWIGNVAKMQQLQQQQVAMMPPMNQTMRG